MITGNTFLLQKYAYFEFPNFIQNVTQKSWIIK